MLICAGAGGERKKKEGKKKLEDEAQVGRKKALAGGK